MGPLTLLQQKHQYALRIESRLDGRRKLAVEVIAVSLCPPVSSSSVHATLCVPQAFPPFSSPSLRLNAQDPTRKCAHRMMDRDASEQDRQQGSQKSQARTDHP